MEKWPSLIRRNRTQAKRPWGPVEPVLGSEQVSTANQDASHKAEKPQVATGGRSGGPVVLEMEVLARQEALQASWAHFGLRHYGKSERERGSSSQRARRCLVV